MLVDALQDRVKDYNEALERFKAFKEKYYTKDTNIGDVIYDKTGNMQKDFEAIFQEPNESEDERIRKEIVDYFTFDRWSGVQPFTRGQSERYLTWLENQKEQKQDIEHIQQSWYMEGYKDREHNRESMWIVKTGEDGPKYEFNLRYGQMLIEQKPTWSEKDEKYLNDAIDACKAQYGNMSYTADWLKNLKERVLPQNPAWSEEDEKISKAIIKRIGGESDALSVSLSSAISWVGNIKDRVQLQNQWKPSDRQINVLEYYMYNLVCNEHKEILFGLYTDLKKLRGR
jgi:hypothetical protein